MHFVEEGGLCKACILVGKISQELRFTPHSRLEARVAVSWLESTLRGLEVLRDASHIQTEEQRRNDRQGLGSLTGGRVSAARVSGEAGASRGTLSTEERRAAEVEAPEEERPRRERRREHREGREHDAKRRRR